jgi:sulfide:quinone oxidoreductase
MQEITDGIYAAGQIGPGDIADAKAMGITTVICNRPDGEAIDQPPAEAVKAAAEAAGMAFHYLPLSPGGLSEDLIEGMRDAIMEASGPVLAYCRSGARSTNLWALAMAPETPPDTLIAKAAGAGYDLNPIRPMLQARHGG